MAGKYGVGGMSEDADKIVQDANFAKLYDAFTYTSRFPGMKLTPKDRRDYDSLTSAILGRPGGDQQIVDLMNIVDAKYKNAKPVR